MPELIIIATDRVKNVYNHPSRKYLDKVRAAIGAGLVRRRGCGG